jgi:hypothetical protein
MKRSEWISTREKLPADGWEVIVCSDSGNVFLAHQFATLPDWYPCNLKKERITHWMPLPLPPQKKEG